MLSVVTSVVCSLILNISLFIIIERIINSEVKLFNIKNIGLIFCIVMIETIFYKMDYSITYTIINYLCTILFAKLIFKENMIKTFTSCSIVYLLLMISDFINSIFFVNFLSYEKIRSVWYIRIISSTIVSLICIILSMIPAINKKCKYFVSKFKEKQMPIITLFIILIIAIILITYGMSNDFKFDISYFSNIFIILTLVIFCYIFINENNQYNKLNDEYDSLLKCVQTFEDWIENEQLTRHEYKNQLAVLRCMTKEKKVKEKIDSIIDNNINIDDGIISQLKNLPSGGFKGLLYYKIVVAKNKKINIEVDVSEEVGKKLRKLKKEELEIISKLIGIYSDNAIEAAKETRKKIVLIEIYEYDGIVNIVISNTYNKKKDIENRNQKGFSTKGEGRGNGLYFANKLISKNKWIEEKQDIVNDFYIQKLFISKVKNTKKAFSSVN